VQKWEGVLELNAVSQLGGCPVEIVLWTDFTERDYARLTQRCTLVRRLPVSQRVCVLDEHPSGLSQKVPDRE
jgi:hypothetical protein